MQIAALLQPPGQTACRRALGTVECWKANRRLRPTDWKSKPHPTHDTHFVPMAIPIERTHFFHGLLLTTEDLQREQDYLFARLRRHNRYLHGWGVIHGLAVHVAGNRVQVNPGLAIDCAGNEIELQDALTADLPAKPSPIYVGIRFCETPAEPTPTIDGIMEHRVWREAPELSLDPDNASAYHARKGPGTPGCGIAHTVVIARLARRQGRWQVRLLNQKRR